MTELISLLNELKTLLAVGDAVKMKLPAEVTDAINKVLAALGEVDGGKASLADVVADVAAIIEDVEKAVTDPDVKQFAGQVLTLIENIRAAVKPSYAPASVIIKDVPPVA